VAQLCVSQEDENMWRLILIAALIGFAVWKGIGYFVKPSANEKKSPAAFFAAPQVPTVTKSEVQDSRGRVRVETVVLYVSGRKWVVWTREGGEYEARRWRSGDGLPVACDGREIILQDGKVLHRVELRNPVELSSVSVGGGEPTRLADRSGTD